MKVRICKDPDCGEPALDQGRYCSLHIGAHRQCKATKPGSEGKIRCKKPALLGLDVCKNHGGGFPAAQEVHKRAEGLTAMQKFVRPYEGHLDPLTAFEMEYRRTLGRIAWYDEQLALLDSEDDLIWGVTKEETIHAAEFTGTNVTKEARVNVLEEMQRWERKHLLDLTKVWLAAGLEQQKLEVLKVYAAKTRASIEKVFEVLGLDLGDARVQDAFRQINDEMTALDDPNSTPPGTPRALRMPQ